MNKANWVAVAIVSASLVAVGLFIFFAAQRGVRPRETHPQVTGDSGRGPDAAGQGRADRPHARLSDFDPHSEDFFAQRMELAEFEGFRTMLELQDVQRAAAPFAETVTISFPAKGKWEATERPIKRDARPKRY